VGGLPTLAGVLVLRIKDLEPGDVALIAEGVCAGRLIEVVSVRDGWRIFRFLEEPRDEVQTIGGECHVELMR
jgi:hypothetical protein